MQDYYSDLLQDLKRGPLIGQGLLHAVYHRDDRQTDRQTDRHRLQTDR